MATPVPGPGLTPAPWAPGGLGPPAERYWLPRRSAPQLPLPEARRCGCACSSHRGVARGAEPDRSRSADPAAGHRLAGLRGRVRDPAARRPGSRARSGLRSAGLVPGRQAGAAPRAPGQSPAAAGLSPTAAGAPVPQACWPAVASPAARAAPSPGPATADAIGPRAPGCVDATARPGRCCGETPGPSAPPGPPRCLSWGRAGRPGLDRSAKLGGHAEAVARRRRGPPSRRRLQRSKGP